MIGSLIFLFATGVNDMSPAPNFFEKNQKTHFRDQIKHVKLTMEFVVFFFNSIFKYNLKFYFTKSTLN
jgi:hypothetical protein